MRMTRDFYRPSTALNAVMATLPDVPGSEVYRYENESGKPCAIVFGGKRSKPDFWFRFPTEERREAKITEWAESQKQRVEATKARRKSQYAQPHGLTIDSVLYTSWGYDQTNVDFYKVVETKGKTMVKIVPIGSKQVRENGSAVYVVADPDTIRDYDVLININREDVDKGVWKRAKLSSYDQEPTITLCSHSWAHLDDGREHYETHYAYGH
ncbi:MAG: hypothetical protein V3U60_11150 [Gammaproteobacteria bacterium]